MRIPAFLPLLGLGVGLVFGAPGRADAQSHHGDGLRARLDSAVPALMAAAEIPGLSAAVVRDGRVYWTGAFGVRSATSRDPVDRNTVFDAASLTKPVVAYAVLRLADRGEIALDTPIADVLPNDRMKHDARYLRITPRMVLSHGTGLPNWGGERLDLAFDPGRGWGYSGEGFVWLANAVEKRTGLPINEVARREAFVPLGMRHSSLVWNDSLEANGAASHSQWGRARPRQRPPADQLGRANAAASLRTTAEDYATFLAAVMEGKGLKPETARQMFGVQNEAKDASSYRSRPAELRSRIAWGLGWGLARGDSGVTFWHWGDNGDAKAYVVGDPRRRTAIVYFANGQTGLAIAGPVASLLFPGEHHPVAWLDYERHDDPARVVRRSLVRAGLDSGGGPAAAARRYEEERSARPAVLTPAVVRGASDALGAERVVAAADTLLALAMRDFPDSTSLMIARGDLHLFAAHTRVANAHYERAAAKAPADSVARQRAVWTREALQAERSPAVVGEDALRRFVGVYGPRTVTLENGRLHYQRAGGLKYPLTAMRPDLFALDANPSFRVQFSTDGSGPASRLIGHYSDGRRDENARTDTARTP